MLGWLLIVIAALEEIATRVVPILRKRLRRKRELAQYLKWIIASVEHTAPDPIVPIYSRFDLPNRYVEPMVTLPNGEKHKARNYLLKRCESEEGFYLLIHGIFGLGKTALILDTGYHLAQWSSKRGRKCPLPFYVPLRRLDVASDRDIENLLDALLKQYKLESYQTFRNFFEKTNSVLFLDGFDQLDMSKDKFRRVQLLGYFHSYLQQISNKRRPRVILTMRSDYFEGSAELSRALNGQLVDHPESQHFPNVPSFERIRLEKFNDDQIREYLRKHPATRVMDAEEILGKFHGDVHLSDFIRHPLLFGMILDVGGATLSGSGIRDIGTIYNLYTEHWFKKDSHLNIFESPDTRRKFIEDLAFSLLKSEAEALFLEEVEGFKGKTDWTFAEEELTQPTHHYYDETRSFLVVNHDGTLMLAHRSLVDYFCAQLLVKALRQKVSIVPEIVCLLYSNLIIWFMRSFIEQNDYEWLCLMADSQDVYVRRFACALLPCTAKTRKDDLIQFFRDMFISEIDMDAKRHIAYGIGWLGEDPFTPEFITFLRSNEIEWQLASAYYYFTTERQRQHCIARLVSFSISNREFYECRGLYIWDLREVGQLEDIKLIQPYTNPSKEPNSEVRKIANEAIGKITNRLRAG